MKRSREERLSFCADEKRVKVDEGVGFQQHYSVTILHTTQIIPIITRNYGCVNLQLLAEKADIKILGANYLEEPE